MTTEPQIGHPGPEGGWQPASVPAPYGPPVAYSPRIAGVVDADGAGTYACMVHFADGTRDNFQAAAEADGKWVTQSR